MENLSPTQQAVLNTASTRPDGKIYPMFTVKKKRMPEAAGFKVEASLLKKNFICNANIITTLGFLAIGLDPKNGDQFDNDVSKAEKSMDTDNQVDTDSSVINLDVLATKTRKGSKKEMVIAMMLKEGGATCLEIAEATKWAPHTIRGFIACTIKKRLGLIVQATREFETIDDGKKKFFTTYRITGQV